ncbi:MAG: hypothetical protein M3156_03440 [Thermoproteota archaeon]|nr:hypothetical protein [Thermoproteota archaeon]
MSCKIESILSIIPPNPCQSCPFITSYVKNGDKISSIIVKGMPVQTVGKWTNYYIKEDNTEYFDHTEHVILNLKQESLSGLSNTNKKMHT